MDKDIDWDEIENSPGTVHYTPHCKDYGEELGKLRKGIEADEARLKEIYRRSLDYKNNKPKPKPRNLRDVRRNRKAR